MSATERTNYAVTADDGTPLTEREFNQVQRLLSDPFSFPLTFKTWLVSYLETSDLVLPKSAVQGLPVALSNPVPPVVNVVLTPPLGGLRVGGTLPTVTP